MEKLTKEFIAAMKKTDRVHFSAEEPLNMVQVCLIREGEDRGFKYFGEIKEFFSLYWDVHKREKGIGDSFYLRASFHIYAGQYGSGEWQALCHLAKPDDELIFRIFVDGNSENHTRIGFHYDAIQVSLWRKGKPVFENMFLDFSVGPDNLARPIQQHKKISPEYQLTD